MRLYHFDTALREGPNWSKNTNIPSLGSPPPVEDPTTSQRPKARPDPAASVRPKARPTTGNDQEPMDMPSVGGIAFKNKQVASEFRLTSSETKSKIKIAAGYFGETITITSGKRTEAQQKVLQKNSPEKAAKKSPHVYTDTALDIRIRGYTKEQVARLYCCLSLAGFRRIGIYDISFHVDDASGTTAFIGKGGIEFYRYCQKRGIVKKHKTGTMNKKDVETLPYIKL